MKSPQMIWTGEIVGLRKVRVCIDKSDVLCVEHMERDAMDNETWVHVHTDANGWREAVTMALRSLVDSRAVAKGGK